VSLADSKKWQANADFDGCMSSGFLLLNGILDCIKTWLEEFRYIRSAHDGQ
jgi:hypothetical protein